MKKLLAIILFSFTTLTSSQEIRANKPIVCMPSEKAARDLKEVGEVVIFNDNNQMTESKSIVVFLQNVETGTWTLLESLDKLVCVLGYGKQIKS